MDAIAYTLISVIIVSLIALFAATPFLLKKKVSQHVLIFLMSFSVGTLLATVFLHFVPEIFAHAHEEGTLGSFIPALLIIAGFLMFFLLERLVHWHHNKDCSNEKEPGHSHAYHLAPINLIGDGVHNFIDGMVIAASFLVSVPVGIASTIAIVAHEIPQELADMGVLLYAGMARKKAIFYNFLSGAVSILGATMALLLANFAENFVSFMLPIAAGSFLYIAASNLVPELHRHCGMKDTVLHVFAILLGVALMVVVLLVLPVHAH